MTTAATVGRAPATAQAHPEDAGALVVTEEGRARMRYLRVPHQPGFRLLKVRADPKDLQSSVYVAPDPPAPQAVLPARPVASPKESKDVATRTPQVP